VYTLGAVTLQRDTNKMVVFTSKINPAGALIGYNLYASGQIQTNLDKVKIKPEDHHRSYFKVF
jgi:hypothetical protein